MLWRVNAAPLRIKKRYLNLQLPLLTATVVIGLVSLVVKVDEALLQTLGLFLVVAVAGVWRIHYLSHKLHDIHLPKLSYVFLFKLLLLLFILYAGWMPQLDENSSSFGYDPQRYYFESYELAQSGFDVFAFPLALRYVGILFYYGCIFAILGHNPAIPALINAFVTLLATLLLVQVGYQIKQKRQPHDWMLGLGMIVPEVLWYDVMTSRETVTMSLTVIATLSVAAYFIRRPDNRFSLWSVAAGVLSLLLIGFIRTPILIPIVLALLLLFVVSKLTVRQRVLFLGLISLIVFLSILAPIVFRNVGSREFDYVDVVQGATSRDEAFLESMTWNENSFGQLLIPNNTVEAVVFTFPRLVFYLVAPLPQIEFSFSGLMSGSWSDWQYVLTALSAILYIALVPLAVAALIQAIRRKEWRHALVLHSPCWAVLIAIAGGNQIIHERYRVTGVLLLWGCIWLGQTCNKNLVQRVYLGWSALLAVGMMLYITYKFF